MATNRVEVSAHRKSFFVTISGAVPVAVAANVVTSAKNIVAAVSSKDLVGGLLLRCQWYGLIVSY